MDDMLGRIRRRATSLGVPRCFAAAARCELHIATAPTYATREAMSPEPSKWAAAGSLSPR